MSSLCLLLIKHHATET